MEQVPYGREAELAVASRVLDRLPSGPAALVLEGEAGIGKTALWQEVVSQAESRSYRVLSCQPTAPEANLSFASLTDLLDEVDEEALEGLPPPQRTALEVALLRREAKSQPERRTVSSAFRGTLLSLSALSPVVVAIDDAHWLDLPSARVLDFALRRLGSAPIGLVLAVRTEEVELPLPELARALPAEQLHRLTLGPVSPEILRGILKVHLSTTFPDSTLLRIHETCAGNPFFALELGRELLRRGSQLQPGGFLPVPSTLRSLIRDRLSELSAPVRQVLLITAAAHFPTVSLIIETKASPTVQDDLEAALSAGVIDLSGDRVRFSHPLLAAVLYAESSASSRRDAHRRLAAVVVDEEERARHLARASEGPDEEVARALEDAAGRARWRGATESAAELSKLARESTPLERHEDRMRRTVRAGHYAFEAAEIERASTLLTEAVRLMASGASRAEALLFLSRVRYHSHDARSAHALAQEALVEAGEAPDLRAEIELELAAAAEASGDHPAAFGHAKEALRIAEHLADDRTLAEALTRVALYKFLSGEGASQEVINRAVALEEAGGGPRPVRSPRFFKACMLMWGDDLPGARSIFGDLEKRCREGGDESSLSVVLFLLSQVECRAGNWTAAHAHADESCAITSWTGQQAYRAFALFAKALVDAHAGRSDAARAAAAEGLSFAERTGSSQATQLNLSVLGFVELSLGNFEGAHNHLWPLAHQLLEAGIGDPGVARFIPDEIEALITLGEIDKAQALLHPFVERAERLSRTWALATGARCEGLLAQSRGDLAVALDAFEQALKIHRELEEPFDLGRTLVTCGQVLRRLKKWGRARESLVESLKIFERLGAEVWASRVRAELARVGGRAPAPLALTATEQRVAELAAGGRTNREIAGSLFLSVSTVEANLRRIYRKLGIRSRTELAHLLKAH